MIHPILSALTGQRFPLEDEKATQVAINDALIAAGLGVSREVPCGRGAIDFVVTLSEPFPPPCRGMRFRHIGIEAKIKGAARSIVRQVKGYASSGDLDAVILVTVKPVALPAEHAGVPLHAFNIAKAWL